MEKFPMKYNAITLVNGWEIDHLIVKKVEEAAHCMWKRIIVFISIWAYMEIVKYLYSRSPFRTFKNIKEKCNIIPGTWYWNWNPFPLKH